MPKYLQIENYNMSNPVNLVKAVNDSVNGFFIQGFLALAVFFPLLFMFYMFYKREGASDFGGALFAAGLITFVLATLFSIVNLTSIYMLSIWLGVVVIGFFWMALTRDN